jgi:hypothetical protein
MKASREQEEPEEGSNSPEDVSPGQARNGQSQEKKKPQQDHGQKVLHREGYNH